MSLLRVDVTIRIDASPSRVWAQFHHERMARWYGPSVQAPTPGALQKGTQLRVLGVGGGYEPRVTDAIENRQLAWESTEPAHRVAFTLGLKNGGTVVLLREEIHPRDLLGRLAEKFYLTGAVVRQNRRALAALKRFVEASA